MRYELVTDRRQLVALCDSISGAPFIAFDTEFVSEDSYLPELCLLQVAAAGRSAVVDALAVEDLSPFWRLLAAPGHETIVHAGREELRFCLRAVGKRPHRLLDVQIAAGLAGLEYPAAYGALVSKVLDKTLGKGETRTNWRTRPLSKAQLEYAVQDAAYLPQLAQGLTHRIEQLGRTLWLQAEMAAWQDTVEACEKRDRWRLVSGVAGLPPRSLAIVRELWLWRDDEARRRNCPPKRVLRDDLIVELARRRAADVKRIRAVRGLDWARMRKHLPALAGCIDKALKLPENQCPKPFRRRLRPQLNVLVQLLTAALGSICRSTQIAAAIVGTSEDVRELIAHRLQLNGSPEDGPPALACGWRAEVVGHALDDLLAGKLCLRVADPLADQPLAFEPAPPAHEHRPIASPEGGKIASK